MTDEVVWWAQRWLDPIVDCRELRAKVRKGRIVARRGRVHQLTVKSGLVTATVEGDSGGALSVRLRMTPVLPGTWELALERISKEAGLAALLLGGRISEQMVQVFERLGAELFPFDHHDLTYFCTCGDDDKVCIHSVAVHLALSEAIAADPLVLLEFRGRSRQELIGALRKQQAEVFEDPEAADEQADETEDATAVIDGFWEGGMLPHLAFRLSGVGVEDEAEALPVIRALGPGPAETPPEVIADVLVPLAKMAQRRIEEIMDQVVEEDEILPQDVSVATAESLDDVLVAAAYQHGSLTSSFVSDALGVSKLEARRYLQWLVEEGRLSQVGRARGTRYVPPEPAPG